MSDTYSERRRRDLHRIHCSGCDDPAHTDTGDVSPSAAREFFQNHPAIEEDRLKRRYFGQDDG